MGMTIDEVIKWLTIMKANLNSFPEVSNAKKIEALGEAIRLLKNEQSMGSTIKNDKVDCIDRQATITFVCKNTKEILKDTMTLEVKLSDDYLYENIAKIMRNPKVLPSVTPIRPKGHWIEEFYDIEGEVRFICSSCGKYQLFGTDFCYNCGSDNREVEE